MAIDPSKPQAAISTPQGNASLDQILASLEGQSTGTAHSSPSPTVPTQTPVSEPVAPAPVEAMPEAPVTEPAPIEPVIEVGSPAPQSEPPSTPEPLPEIKISEESVSTPSVSETIPSDLSSTPTASTESSSVTEPTIDLSAISSSPTEPASTPVPNEAPTETPPAPDLSISAETTTPGVESPSSESVPDEKPLDAAGASPTETSSFASNLEEKLPETTPDPTSTETVTAPDTNASASFSIDEKPLESAQAPEPIPTVEANHDAIKEEDNTLTPPPEVVAPANPSESTLTPTPAPAPDLTTSSAPEPAPAPAQEKQAGGGGGFHLPKFAIAGLAVLIMLVGSVAAYFAIGQPFGSVDIRQQATDCTIQYDPLNSSTKTSFTVTNCAGRQIERFEGTSCPTTSVSVGKETVPSNSSMAYQPNPPPGKCQQVDHHFSGTYMGNSVPAGGVCKCNGTSTPPPQKRACGEACTSQSDCRNPSTGGFPVECRNGKCQLPLTGPYACAEGKSEGSICSCSGVQQCGQPCGPTAGNKLCGAGSTCGFIKPFNACVQDSGGSPITTQYCLPIAPQNGYKILRCSTIAANSLVKPDGTQTGLTQQDVITACTPPQPTQTPTPTPTVPPSLPPFVCLNITKDIASPKMGDQVRFTCGTVSSATRYEFRYKNSVSGSEGTLDSISTNSNVSQPLVITLAGSYKVQCRPCNGNSCTNWENW